MIGVCDAEARQGWLNSWGVECVAECVRTGSRLPGLARNCGRLWSVMRASRRREGAQMFPGQGRMGVGDAEKKCGKMMARRGNDDGKLMQSAAARGRPAMHGLSCKGRGRQACRGRHWAVIPWQWQAVSSRLRLGARQLRVVACRLLRHNRRRRQRLRLAARAHGHRNGTVQAGLSRQQAAVAGQVEPHQGTELLHLCRGWHAMKCHEMQVGRE